MGTKKEKNRISALIKVLGLFKAQILNIAFLSVMIFVSPSLLMKNNYLIQLLRLNSNISTVT